MKWLALLIGLLADLLLFASRSFNFFGKELEAAGIKYIVWCEEREAEKAKLKLALEREDESI